MIERWLVRKLGFSSDDLWNNDGLMGNEYLMGSEGLMDSENSKASYRLIVGMVTRYANYTMVYWWTSINNANRQHDLEAETCTVLPTAVIPDLGNPAATTAVTNGDDFLSPCSSLPGSGGTCCWWYMSLVVYVACGTSCRWYKLLVVQYMLLVVQVSGGTSCRWYKLQVV